MLEMLFQESCHRPIDSFGLRTVGRAPRAHSRPGTPVRRGLYKITRLKPRATFHVGEKTITERLVGRGKPLEKIVATQRSIVSSTTDLLSHHATRIHPTHQQISPTIDLSFDSYGIRHEREQRFERIAAQTVAF